MSPLWLLVATLAVGDVGGTQAPVGLHVGAGAGVGVVGGDVVGVIDVGLGIETAPFALHLRAAPTLRLVDLPPTVSSSLPSSCRLIRCEEALSGNRLDPTALARIIDEVRILRPGDVFHARVGRLTATLGAGATVDRLTTMASWDRRTSGAYAALNLPWQILRADLVVADVISPLELMAGRIELAPIPFLPLVVGSEVAVDVFAPDDVVDAAGAIRLGAVTRPLGLAVLDVRAPLTIGPISLVPRAEASVATGFTATGGELPSTGAFGGGASVGLDAGFKVAFLDLRGQAIVGASSPGHRRGAFSTFYLVERRRAFLGSVVDGGGIAHVPAPGGLGVDVRLDASVLDAVAPIVRLHVEPANGANALELGTVVDVDPVQISVSAIRRGFVSVVDIVDGDVAAHPLLMVAEAGWRFYGPLSVWARWYRLPRFTSGALVFDDDVLVGISVNAAFSPR